MRIFFLTFCTLAALLSQVHARVAQAQSFDTGSNSATKNFPSPTAAPPKAFPWADGVSLLCPPAAAADIAGVDNGGVGAIAPASLRLNPTAAAASPSPGADQGRECNPATLGEAEPAEGALPLAAEPQAQRALTVAAPLAGAADSLPAPAQAGADALPPAMAQSSSRFRNTVPTPLERPPIRLFNLETANQLPANALNLSFGFHQGVFDDTPGTGSQLYYINGTYGITDDLQVSLGAQLYDDPPTQPINGQSPNFTLFTLAPSVKYQFLESDGFSVGVQGSVELFSLSTLFNPGSDADFSVIGSLHVPATYEVSPEFQVHVTPGVSFYPGSINGLEFYDTLFTLGAGANWQPSNRWLVYGALNWPIGPGGNTINDDLSIGRRIVWTFGSQYNVTPKVGVNLYATNGLGTTPATQILTSIPEGNKPLIGLQLNYTPDLGLGYSSTFRDTPLAPLSARDRQLLIDGFTLTSASVLEPGRVALTAGGGTRSTYNFGVAYSPDQDFQLELVLEDYASGGGLTSADTAGDSLRYMFGAKVRLFDQLQGDPLSLSARVMGGRDFDSNQTIGVIFADLPMLYQFTDATAVVFNPRLAAFGDEVLVGLGVGVNQQVAEGLQLIGEVTPVFGGSRLVWAVGARYTVPDTLLSVDLFTTNAAGTQTLGTLVGQTGARVGAALSWILGN